MTNVAQSLPTRSSLTPQIERRRGRSKVVSFGCCNSACNKAGLTRLFSFNLCLWQRGFCGLYRIIAWVAKMTNGSPTIGRCLNIKKSISRNTDFVLGSLNRNLKVEIKLLFSLSFSKSVLKQIILYLWLNQTFGCFIPC